MTTNKKSDRKVTDTIWNSDEFSERLLSIIKGESATSFASKCGFGESLLRKYLSGTMPGADKLIIMSKVANVSLDWLATGKGPMMPNEVSEAQNGYKVDKGALITNQLDKIEKELEEKPVNNDNLLKIHDELETIALNKDLPQKLISRANRILSESLDDQEAEERLERDFYKIRKQFGAIMHDYADASKQIGYEPPILIKEAIKTVMYTQGLTKEGAAILLNALKEQLNYDEK